MHTKRTATFIAVTVTIDLGRSCIGASSRAITDRQELDKLAAAWQKTVDAARSTP